MALSSSLPAYSGNAPQNQTDSQLSATQLRAKYNYQKQRPYAAQTGMASGEPVAQPLGSSTGSPVTATGQISQNPLPSLPPGAVPPPGYVDPRTGAKPGATAASATGQTFPATGAIPAPRPGAAPPPQTYYQYQGSPLMDSAAIALQQALMSPVFSPDVVAQMKGAQHDTIGTGLNQAQEALQQNAASRGMLNSGAEQAGERKLLQAGIQDQSNAFRDIDLQAALGNREDMRSNVQAALAQVLGEEGLDQASANSGLNAWQAALGGMLQNKGIDVGAATDRYRAQLGALTGLYGILSNNEQFMGDLGYRYTALNANQQQALWDSLLRGF